MNIAELLDSLREATKETIDRKTPLAILSE
jgi:hypothetical protein